MNNPLRMLLPCVVTALTLINTGAVSAERQIVTVTLTPRHVTSFTDMLTALVDQAHIAVVAEGVPLHPLLSAHDAAPLMVPMVADKAVEAFAAAYDYAVIRDGDVYVLTKRYTNSDDLPAVTQAECEYCIQEIAKITAPFNPNVPLFLPHDLNHSDTPERNDPLMEPLISSLTQEQMNALESRGLPAFSLSATQRAQIRRILLRIYVQSPIETTSQALPSLQEAEQEATFTRQDIGSASGVFGYTLPDRPGGVIPFHPLGQFNGMDNLDGLMIIPSRPAPSGPDPTAPVPGAVTPGGSQTVAMAVADVAASYASVDPSVAAKPVTFAGLGNAAPDRVLRAVADVYGLSVVDTQEGGNRHVTLTLPDVAPPSDVDDLPSALRQTLPAPLARALHLDTIVSAIDDDAALADAYNNSSPSTPQSGVEETPDELKKAMLERQAAVAYATPGRVKFAMDYTRQASASLTAVRDAAIRRLRALVEPRLQGAARGVKIAEIGPQEHDALATVFLTEEAQGILSLLTQPMPPEFQHMDQVILHGGPRGSSNNPKFRLSIDMTLPGGRMLAGPGVISYD